MEGASKQDYSEAFVVSFGEELRKIETLGCKFKRRFLQT